MRAWLLVLIGTALIVALDYLWLGVLMSGFYERIPGRGEVNVYAAILTWAAISLGVVLFALPRAGSWQTALVWGALFGFVLYAVYDLTNLAVLADWPLPVVLVDIAWGTALCSIISTVLYVLQ